MQTSGNKTQTLEEWKDVGNRCTAADKPSAQQQNNGVGRPGRNCVAPPLTRELFSQTMGKT
jgi:hypothetical protein